MDDTQLHPLFDAHPGVHGCANNCFCPFPQIQCAVLFIVRRYSSLGVFLPFSSILASHVLKHFDNGWDLLFDLMEIIYHTR